MKQADKPYHEASQAERDRRVAFCLRAAGYRPELQTVEAVPIGEFNRPLRTRAKKAPTDGCEPGERLGNDPRLRLGDEEPLDDPPDGG